MLVSGFHCLTGFFVNCLSRNRGTQEGESMWPPYPPAGIWSQVSFGLSFLVVPYLWFWWSLFKHYSLSTSSFRVFRRDNNIKRLTLSYGGKCWPGCGAHELVVYLYVLVTFAQSAIIKILKVCLKTIFPITSLCSPETPSPPHTPSLALKYTAAYWLKLWLRCFGLGGCHPQCYGFGELLFSARAVLLRPHWLLYD